MEAQWYLHGKDFFSELIAEKKIFISRSKKRDIRKNEFLFTDGGPGDSVFYLRSGQVRISHVTSVGKESIVFIRHAGEIFGLAEALCRTKRACSARAMTACSLYEIKSGAFEKLLSQYWTLSRRVMEVLGSRLRYLGEQLENLMSCDVTTRLLKLLFYLSFQKQAEHDVRTESITVPIKLTQEQIAAMIGSCQQTVSEIFKQLQEDGLIRISRKKREITILNPARLLNSL